VDDLQKKLREAEQQLRALRDEATKQRDVAEQQRRIADEARARAEKALQDALVQRERAEAERQRAAAERARAVATERQAKDAEAAAVARLGEAVSTRNLTMIGLALRKYHEHRGTLPTAALHSKDGKPLLSWRVALLPYLGEEKLYDQFKFDEPWDSPHNKRLIARMPKVFALANSTPEKGQTFYRVFHGQGAAFEGKQGVRLASFVDGTANTAVVVEASASSEWTRPEELPFAEGKALPGLGGVVGGGFHVLLADGTVRYILKKVDERTLRALITRNGGETIDIEKLAR